MNTTIQAIIKNEKTILPAGGKDTVCPDDANFCYYVRDGKVDLFAIIVEEGGAPGALNHLVHIDAGAFFFGLPGSILEKEGMAILASGIADTKLIKIPLSKVKGLARESKHAEAVASIIDGWLGGIARMLPGSREKNFHPKDMVAPDQVVLAQGESARPLKGTVWISGARGSVSIHGDESLPLPGGDKLSPVSHPSWITAPGECRIRAVGTSEAMGRRQFWPCLGEHYAVLIRLIKQRLRDDLSLERERLAQRSANEQGMMSEALNAFSRIIDPGREVPSKLETDDPMMTVCREVAAQLKIELQAPMHFDGAAEGKHMSTLAAIARASRIRTRRVALKGAWWKRDNGPMVGYLLEDKRPVALLQKSPARYELYDPQKGECVAVTAEVADRIDYFADVLYRTFAARTVTGWGLISFGIAGRSRDLITILLMGLFGGLLGLLTPIITGIIFDEVIPGAQLNQLVMLSMAMLVAGLASACFELTRRLALMRMEGRMDQHVQGAVIDRLIELPTGFFKTYSTGDLAERAMGINAIRQVLSGTTINAILSGIFSIFNLFLLFYYSAELAWWALLITLVLIIVIVAANYFQLRIQKTMADASGRLSGTVLEFVTGVSKLRVAGCEGRAFSIWANMFGAMKGMSRTSQIIANSVQTIVSFVPIVSSMIIYVLIFYMSAEQPLSLGSFLAFSSSFSMFMSSTLRIVESLVTTLSIVPLYQRSTPILTSMPETDLEKSHPGALTGRLEINHVSFSYNADGPRIIDDVTIHLEPGEFVALVGPSGSGKSTIIRLLLGFENPESGSIFYDEQDLAGLDVRAVRQQMGVVLQNGQVMSGDILSNIVGSSLLTVDDAWDAARISGLYDDIKAMPMGMYTVISDGGGTLSGGQRQRLLIARALVKKPKIIIFDEATSALDNETQMVVNKSLEQMNITRIVIAHRLSTIVNADRIYVLDGGRVVQTGSYRELINKKGVFSELAKRQVS